MGNDVVIRSEGLSKSYRLGGYGATSFHEELVDFWEKRILRKGGQNKTSKSTFWALNDVSFEVKEGEKIGLIGRNGAGKSTLLKLLARITTPTKGYAHLYGKVAALLEVGTGFHPELTGIENIYLNGAILGMRRPEVRSRIDSIVDFSGMHKFVDTPVKRYSSGMKVKLAFAVAAHLQQEIMIVDEVLAVGDRDFQKKCVSKMGEVARNGRTIVLVSHNMMTISQLCDKTMYLKDGKLLNEGPTDQIIKEYLADGLVGVGYHEWEHGIADPGVTEFLLHSINVKDKNGESRCSFSVLDDITIDVDFEITERIWSFAFKIGIRSDMGANVTSLGNSRDVCNHGFIDPGNYRYTFTIPRKRLNWGRYFLAIYANSKGSKFLLRLDDILNFEVELFSKDETHLDYASGFVYPDYELVRTEIPGKES
ncbi:MAG: ABC transporter ATP-binding protein [Opitutales bacterium]|nr:ABC transporter ATP-binding protein [Opitutales bacterium]